MRCSKRKTQDGSERKKHPAGTGGDHASHPHPKSGTATTFVAAIATHLGPPFWSPSLSGCIFRAHPRCTTSSGSSYPISAEMSEADRSLVDLANHVPAP